MMRATDNAAIRSAIGVGTTDAPTFLSVGISAVGGAPSSGMSWDVNSHLVFSHNGTIRMVLISTGTTLGADMGYAWASGFAPTNSTRDLILARDAAGILAQRNGTAKQALRVYNTNLSGAPEWAEFDWITSGGTNTLRIGTNLSGTGAARPIDFVTGGVARWQISAAGHLMSAGVTDNAYDIGASGANRPRHIYTGSSIQTTGYCLVGSNNGYFWPSKGGIYAPSDGVMRLSNDSVNGFTRLELGAANLGISRGTGSPEGVVTALVGSLYIRTDGGVLSTLYVKESSPTPTTGWVAK